MKKKKTKKKKCKIKKTKSKKRRGKKKKKQKINGTMANFATAGVSRGDQRIHLQSETSRHQSPLQLLIYYVVAAINISCFDNIYWC